MPEPADILLGSHLIFLSGLAVAPFVLPKPWLEKYQYIPPVVGASWLLDDGRCILSDWEYSLRRKDKCTEPNLFQHVGKMVNIDMDTRTSNILGWVMLGTCFFVTRNRLK